MFIAEEMKKYRQWINWVAVQDGEKTTKIPIMAGTGRPASVNDPDTWSDFETAWNWCKSGHCDGVGFVFTKGDPFCFIDIDDCVDDQGNIDPEAKKHTDRLNSLTELSQSHRGLHVFCIAKKPEWAGSRKGNFEIYDHGRFCAITGDVLDDYPLTIEHRQDQVNEICEEMFGLPKEPAQKEPSQTTIPDQEIIQKLNNNEKFRRLFVGDISGYPSQSEADLALVSLIGYYTQDFGQILRIVKQSGLWDEKWEREDYQQRTIQKAISERAISRENIDDLVEKNKVYIRYFTNGRFIPAKVADELMSEFSFIYAGGQLYVYKNGVYVPYGVDFVKHVCYQRLGDEGRINRINEVVAYIQYMNLVEPEKINRHKYLINLENGMFDVRTKTLLDHSKEYLSTIRIPVVYDPSVSCDPITDWLESTLDAECVQLAMEIFAYVLIPDTSLGKAFMFVGSGANGKSTFLTVLENFVGKENVSKVPLQELSEHRFKRAELFGKLVNLFADLDSRALESTTYFKTIVTGDAIDAERKNRDPFSFRPFARLIFSANEIPRSRDQSFAYYRRWCIIPFERQFVGGDEKKGLAEQLSTRENLSALLNNALTELSKLLKNQKFTEPKKVVEALSEYEKQNDPVKAFVSERCVFDPNARVERGVLYDAFNRYCTETGYKPVTNRCFYQRIRGFSQIFESQQDDGKRVFVGLQLAECQNTTHSQHIHNTFTTGRM